MEQEESKHAFVVRETRKGSSAVRYSVRVGTGPEDADYIRLDRYYYATEREALEAAGILNLLLADAISTALVKVASVLDRKHKHEVVRLSEEITAKLKEHVR